jgi:hypothetical protein
MVRATFSMELIRHRFVALTDKFAGNHGANFIDGDIDLGHETPGARASFPNMTKKPRKLCIVCSLPIQRNRRAPLSIC